MNEKITMRHSKDTVRRLSVVQYNTFAYTTKMAWYSASFILIMMGFGLIYDIGTPWRYFLLAIGCLIFGNVGASADFKAQQTLQAIEKQGGVFPETHMEFFEKNIRVTELESKPHTLKYKDLLKVVEDADYFFLFITKEAAYMVPKNQLNDVDAFRTHLVEETGSKIAKNHSGSAFSVRLKDIIHK